MGELPVEPASEAKCTPTNEELQAMRDSVQRALKAAEASGKAGIAAALLLNGKLVATGENEVRLHSDPTRHAEMVAISRAAEVLHTTDLAGCVLISTLQPCEMCLAAMRFAGIRRVVFAATQEHVAPKYFVFPHLGIADFHRPGTFEWIGGVCEAEVLHFYIDGQE